MMKVLFFTMVSGVISPTMAPPSQRQYFGSPDQPFNVLPSKRSFQPSADSSEGIGIVCLGLAGPVSAAASDKL